MLLTKLEEALNAIDTSDLGTEARLCVDTTTNALGNQYRLHRPPSSLTRFMTGNLSERIWRQTYYSINAAGGHASGKPCFDSREGGRGTNGLL